MGHVDLDAARAARAEALKEPNTVNLDGREFKLLPELPIDAALAYRRAFLPAPADKPGERDRDIDAAREFVRLVLAHESEVDEFWTARPSWGDIRALIGVYTAPADDAGESSASDASSPKGGKRSRRTSPRTTKST